MKNLIEQTKSKCTEAEKEEILKAQGIRAVSVSLIVPLAVILPMVCPKGLNVFFNIENSDSFKALSFDRMHNMSHCLGGKHIWPEIQDYVEAYIRKMGYGPRTT